ncbi:MAG: hypothetical protein KDA61_16235, partial [Planctomycetales bacterium]|nr:hypothetical protein [Planctomycetales bacterium]
MNRTFVRRELLTSALGGLGALACQRAAWPQTDSPDRPSWQPPTSQEAEAIASHAAAFRDEFGAPALSIAFGH